MRNNITYNSCPAGSGFSKKGSHKTDLVGDISTKKNNLNLENKDESLVRRAAIHNKDVMAELIVKELSIRLHRLIIINEKECLKIKTKRLMDGKERIARNP